jgi:hypothetical protein
MREASMAERIEAASPVTEPAGGHVAGRRRWLVALVALAALAWALLAPPPLPAGGTRLSAFSPEQLASLEQAAWEAYYYRQWPRLFWLMLRVMRDQFGLSWAQALYAASLNTQAQLIFARQGDQGGAAEAAMRRFYTLVREPLGAGYDPDRAAAAELRWWVVHRRRHDYPDSSELVKAMTALYAEVYGLPEAAVEAAARGRVRAVEVSDQWLDQQQPAGSPLLRQVRAELLTGYTALKEALQRRTPVAHP